MTFSRFMAHLDELGLFHMDLTLERMRAFMLRAGQPRHQVLHVVGTNGKGSTATILAELLQAHGLRVGLYTSPHFVSVRERILVDGRMLPEDDWASLGAEALELSQGLGLTYFELLTAVAVLAFRRAGVDVAVLEAGLGGRYDASNVLEPSLTVFTPIAMDHMNVLGGTLAEIAADKAGAMRSGGVAVSAPQLAQAWRVLRDGAAEAGSSFIAGHEVLFYSRANGRVQPGPAGRGFVRAMTGLFLGLQGEHQEHNARTALAAFHVWAKRLRLPIIEDACRKAFARAFIPGRLQRVAATPNHPELLLDGGHNAHGLEALARALSAQELRPGAVIFGCLRDKPLDDMLPLVRAMTDGPLIAVGIPSCPRAMEPQELAALLGPGARHAENIHVALEGLRAAAGGAPDSDLGPVPSSVLICGSLYLLGEFYTTHHHLLDRPGSQEVRP